MKAPFPYPVDFKIGDMVHPLKLWNRTERLENQLPDPVEILDIAVGRQVSQTGIMLLVQDNRGGRRWLDSGWFKR